MSRFFIDRPIVAIVIAILTVIGGVVVIQRLPIAQYPDIVPPMIQISATYTGADAITVEETGTGEPITILCGSSFRPPMEK